MTGKLCAVHKNKKGQPRVCRVCGVLLTNLNWQPARKRGHKYICRSCDRSSQRESKRWAVIKLSYGLTKEGYNLLYEQQNGCCAICGVSAEQLDKSLYIDHDHTTRKVRGLLCGLCNLALGGFKDNPDILTKAIQYLQK